MSDSQERALRDLTALTAMGPRFHGTPGIHRAQAWLMERLEQVGATVRTHEVSTPGWDPGQQAEVRVQSPVERSLTAWPMLWSAPSNGRLTARLRPVGLQGLWGDALLWTKCAAVVGNEIVAYLHARDDGPAAPQPLPIGSDLSVPHLAIGRIDGLAISEWLGDGHDVDVLIDADPESRKKATSRSIIVDVPSAGAPAEGRAIVCGHYDTFWNTPGAYDNGSGTIALLHLVGELLRMPPARPVTVVFTAAEEWHLAGSRALVASLSEAERTEIDFAINLDGLGRGDFLEVFAGPETFECRVLDEIRVYAEQTRGELRVRSRFPPTCGTDHAAFYAAGIPAVHLTFNDLHRLHQPDDLPNPGIARNIAWTVPLVIRMLARLGRPERVPAAGMQLPF